MAAPKRLGRLKLLTNIWRPRLVGDDVFSESDCGKVSTKVGNASGQLNQIGTVTETPRRRHGCDAHYATIISHAPAKPKIQLLPILRSGRRQARSKRDPQAARIGSANTTSSFESKRNLDRRRLMPAARRSRRCRTGERRDAHTCSPQTWIQHLESGKPVHRMDRRRSFGEGPG